MNDQLLKDAVDALRKVADCFEASWSDGSAATFSTGILEDAPKTMGELPEFFSRLTPAQARASFIAAIASSAAEDKYTTAELVRALVAAKNAMFPVAIPRVDRPPAFDAPRQGRPRAGLSPRRQAMFDAMVKAAPRRGDSVFVYLVIRDAGINPPGENVRVAHDACVASGHFRAGPMTSPGPGKRSARTLIRVTDGPADPSGRGQSAATQEAGAP